ncbi:MAG: Ig domain-containing protein [Bacilli bacterium]|nr:Ig domain-containing protein [Bacilli bacterium]
MNNKVDDKKEKKLDITIKIILIIIIIILLIHNCVINKNKNNEKIPTGNVDIIEIMCDKEDKCVYPSNKQIESLSFASKSVSIKKGNSYNLIVTVEPSGALSSKFTWKSSNPYIVIVDENGKIKGLNIGKATITVTSSNGKTTTCVVEVVSNEVSVEKISLTSNNSTIEVGSVIQINAIIEPDNATNRDLVWESSDTSIATVDNKGVVKGLKGGIVTITAKTKEGKVIGTTTITIEEPINDTEGMITVYDNDITWHGQTDAKIFTNSMYEFEDIIAPESSNTYQFVVKNSVDFNIKYDISFIEDNPYNINMRYKLKKNNTYLVDHYVSANELNINNMIINNGENDTYYLEWKWISSDNDTQIGKNLDAKYGLSIEVKAESTND